MHRNATWIAFLLLVVGLVVWFTVHAGGSIYRYWRLQESAPATITSWKITETKRDNYLVKAHFTFTYQGNVIEGESHVGKIFPNPWAAEIGIKTYAKRSWRVFFDPKNPQNATFQKKFPVKSTLSAVIMIGLLLYFISLGRYVYTQSSGGST